MSDKRKIFASRGSESHSFFVSCGNTGCCRNGFSPQSPKPGLIDPKLFAETLDKTVRVMRRAALSPVQDSAFQRHLFEEPASLNLPKPNCGCLPTRARRTGNSLTHPSWARS